MELSFVCISCRVNTIRRIFTPSITDDVAAIDYMTGEVLEGYLPPKALAMVREWIALHKDTLQEIWETQEFKKIPPLE